MNTRLMNFVNVPIGNIRWRVDTDGFLRVTMQILHEGVYKYRQDELDPEKGSSSVMCPVYIPLSQFSDPDAMQSVEGKPLVRDSHFWRNIKNAATDMKTVGSVAGKASVKDGGLYVDGLIMDLQTSKDIQEGKLVEVSAAYLSAVQDSEGEFEGQTYNHIQTTFEFNHIAILEAGKGRCGHGVRIVNDQTSPTPVTVPCQDETNNLLEVQMYVLHTKIGNEKTARSLKLADESEVQAVENAIDSHTAYYEERLSEMSATRDKVQEALAEVEKKLEIANAKIKELSNPELIKDVQEATRKQKKLENAILTSIGLLNSDEDEDKEENSDEDEDKEENSDEDEDKEENSDEDEDKEENSDEDEDKEENTFNRKGFGNKSLAERRKGIVDRVMTANGQSIPKSWTQEQYDAAFDVLVMQAKKVLNKKADTGRKVRKVPAGGVTAKTNNGLLDARSRMLQPMTYLKSVNGNK